MQSTILTGDIKDVKGNIIGAWGEIRPLLTFRGPLIKILDKASYRKLKKKAGLEN